MSPLRASLVSFGVAAALLLACSGSPSAGEPCSAEAVCQTALTCSPVTKLCVSAGSIGAPCVTPSDCSGGAFVCRKGVCAERVPVGGECEATSDCGVFDQEPVCARLSGSPRGICSVRCDTRLADKESCTAGNQKCCKLGDLPVTACVTSAFCTP